MTMFIFKNMVTFIKSGYFGYVLLALGLLLGTIIIKKANIKSRLLRVGVIIYSFFAVEGLVFLIASFTRP